ncbi:hypothetical protein [Tahibacter sp.]|uniref:hypothetical protein n=1 Tax=Tahibacter sp. TaxID=2056211 RepID=UPI0028C37A04|nr:hypothetical protein [Tahibacter sp.]
MARALRRIGWLLALLFVLYLIAANVFLNAGFGPGLINRKPDRFSMQWEHGLSLYPGHVVLWQAKFRGHARRIAWHARADRLSGRIALWPLLRRELQVPHTWADQVTGGLDLTHELEPAEPRPGGWVLRFDRIATDSLREARWGSHTLTSDGRAEFGMWKQLRGGALEIFPSQATLRTVRLRQGDIDWLRDATLAVRFALPRHTRDEAAGWHRLALATLSLELDGQVPAFAVHMDEEPRWRGAVGQGEGGTVHARLALERGELMPGGVLTLGVPLQATDSAGKRWTQQANLQGRVAETIELKLDLPPPPSGKGRISADLRVAGREVIPHQKAPPLLPRVSGTVGVQWRFDSLDWFGPLLAKAAWLHLDGAGEIDANILLKDGRIDAGSTLKIPDVAWHADVQGERFTGRARADGRVDTEDGELRPRVDIVVQQFQIGESASPQQAMVRGKNLRLELRSTGRVIEFRDSLRARLVFERADVPDLRGFNRYLPGHTLRFLGGRGQLSGDLQLDPAGKVGKGRLQVQARQAQLALSDLEFSGDVDVAAQLARADLGNEEFVLDGTRLGVRNVKVSDPERASPGDWWADIRFDRGRLHWGSPLRIDATASARLHDVSLLLALFTRNKDYPRWVLRLLDAGVVDASMRAVMRDGAIVLEDLSVSNDRFDLKARVRLADKRAQGALFLRWARLGLGLELKDDERKFHLLKAAEWFGQQPRLLPAAR